MKNLEKLSISELRKLQNDVYSVLNKKNYNIDVSSLSGVKQLAKKFNQLFTKCSNGIEVAIKSVVRVRFYIENDYIDPELEINKDKVYNSAVFKKFVKSAEEELKAINLEVTNIAKKHNIEDYVIWDFLWNDADTRRGTLHTPVENLGLCFRREGVSHNDN